MSTIKEIAAKAGVSVATVSKVLNGKGGAGEKTAQEIIDIAKRMNYSPNIMAKSLKNRQSRTIGIITEDITVFNTPEIVDGIDDICEQRGYHYFLGNLRLNKRFGHNFFESDKHHDLIDSTIHTMLSKQIEGLIYIGCHSHEIHYLPEDLKIPMVCAYCFSSNPVIPSVTYDDKKAAYDATCLLLDHGHKSVGVICGLPESTHTQNRLRGYQEALYDHSILFNPNLVVTGDWERESGYHSCRQLIDSNVTAIFAHNDVMACGVIDYCNETGINIGPDLSLVGFDNKEISTVCRPKLSTVSLPLFEIGHGAADILLDILEGKDANPQHRTKMECRVIERQSVEGIK